MHIRESNQHDSEKGKKRKVGIISSSSIPAQRLPLPRLLFQGKMCSHALREDRNGNIDSRVDSEARNALHYLFGGMEINHTLVDLHLKGVPRVGTITTRGLSSGDLKSASGKTARAVHLYLILKSALQVRRGNFLQCLGVARNKGHPARLDLLRGSFLIFFQVGHIYKATDCYCKRKKVVDKRKKK